MKKLIFLLLGLPIAGWCQESDFGLNIIPLYKDSIPNSTGFESREIVGGPVEDPVSYRKTCNPALIAYLPQKEKQSRAAVIIFPGGAYGFLAFKEEGSNIAKYFAGRGITAFVVKYRLPDNLIMKDRTIGPLQDAQQAIKMVRMYAAEWGIDTAKIGVMGFSAGGHLASTLATHYSEAVIPNKENTNLRPDFLVLVYPVISMMNGLTHSGSKDNLLGRFPTQNRIKSFSNELQVTGSTPPTWLTHAADDNLVTVDNSVEFFRALKRHNVPAELHIYPKGDHGFVLRQPVEHWMASLLFWMGSMGWIDSRKLPA